MLFCPPCWADTLYSRMEAALGRGDARKKGREMRRSATGVLIVTAALVAILAVPVQAADALEAHMAAYRQRVLTPPTPPPAPVAPSGGSTWDRLSVLLLAATETEPDAASTGTFTPWRQRRGPAYPDDSWRSVGRDLQELPSTLWDDTKATFTDPVAITGLLAAGVAGIAINASDVDNTVKGRTAGNRQLSKSMDGIGGFFGSPAVHFPFAGAMYVTGLVGGNEKTYETSKSLMNALVINGITTMALKVATRTESPNGDEFGWPSGHTSSSFCLATVMHEAYGPWVGVPLFAFATFVGYERIDARNHDFSDVVSGAVIGFVIGHVVANNHDAKIFGLDVLPYADPNSGAVGVALGKVW